MNAPLQTDEPLVGIVTTDLAAITRGRFVPAKHFDRFTSTGIGWLQANISLTAFNSIATPNPWGSRGDLRMLPDAEARFRTSRTGSATPFDMVCGNLVELDGKPWALCTRTLLRQALQELKTLCGWSVRASFEQEFQLFERGESAAHSLSLQALRAADPFASRVMSALDEAGVEPEVVIAEFGADQFEVTCAPAEALRAADRSIAIREIVREIARLCGWRASFSPKTAPAAVGSGVHIHFSFLDAAGKPVMYDPAEPASLSKTAGSFCAGALRHMPAITALAAPSVPSYYRLKPHSWSAAYTSLGERDREAALRICPVFTGAGHDPARQYNIEYRAADATANPYLTLTAILRAGMEGIRAKLPSPPLTSADPSQMSEQARRESGLVRLPEDLHAALAALAADPVVNGWFDPLLIESFRGVRLAEIAALADKDTEAVCRTYRTLY